MMEIERKRVICFWFDPSGRDTPRGVARKFVNLLKEAQHA